jgi:prolyl oligopeptidase
MTSRECSYPSVEEVIHGVVVNDPYRWLEGRELPETQEWIREQGERCGAYFESCDAFGLLRGRVERYLNVEIVDQPARAGNRYVYRRRNKDQEQACIYVMDIKTNQERLLVDPSGEGPFASVGIHRVGATALIRTPREPYSRARARVKFVMAPFAAL